MTYELYKQALRQVGGFGFSLESEAAAQKQSNEHEMNGFVTGFRLF